MALELEQVTRAADDFAVALADFCVKVGAKDVTELIDNVEAFIADKPQVECPSGAQFYDGLCTNETFIPGGTVFVTETHETCHPLFLMQGIISIFTQEKGVLTFSAPCILKTMPGTRRIAYAHTDTTGVTVHATTGTDIKEIRQQITSRRQNPLLIA